MYDYKKIARKIAKEFISAVNIANQYEFDDALKIAIKNGIALLEKNNACWENQKKARDLLAKKRLSY